MKEWCGCEACVTARLEEALCYALTLEKAVLEIQRLLNGEAGAALALLDRTAALARSRNLTAEVAALAAWRNEQRAAEIRAAGRLH